MEKSLRDYIDIIEKIVAGHQIVTENQKLLQTESFDRKEALEAYKRLHASPLNRINLTAEDQQLWLGVIQAVREKLNHMRDNHSEIKRDWPIVANFIKQNESQVMMGGWDTWFKTGQIRHNPQIINAQIVQDPYDKLDVTKTMYDFAQWVFMGKDLEGKIKRNSLTKRDIPTIDKIRVLLRDPVSESRRHERITRSIRRTFSCTIQKV
jgi:hypothetical protein